MDVSPECHLFAFLIPGWQCFVHVYVWSLSLGMARDGVIASTQETCFTRVAMKFAHNVIGRSCESLLALLTIGRNLFLPIEYASV